MSTPTASDHRVVSHSEWMKSAAEFLAEEKELLRKTDELSRKRRALPWTKIDKAYEFDSTRGPVGLADLFDGKNQLAVYHFMFAPDWNEGCPSCSYVTDHLNATFPHLRARDVSLVLVSRAPLAKLTAFRERLGWQIPWVSSGGCDFNRDFGVSFSKQEAERGDNLYNLETRPPYEQENPGLTVFTKDPSGAIYRTYSTYARGVEAFLTTYTILDRVPKGRDEDPPQTPMGWVRYHDKYEAVQELGSCCRH